MVQMEKPRQGTTLYFPTFETYAQAKKEQKVWRRMRGRRRMPDRSGESPWTT